LLQLKEHFTKDDVVVILLHDPGRRYVGKRFNDEWMRSRGFLDDKVTKAIDLIKDHVETPLVTVKTEELVMVAIERMKNNNISQIPVEDVDGFVGSVDESILFRAIMDDASVTSKPIKEVMQDPFPIVDRNTSIDHVAKLIQKDVQAVLLDLGDGKHHIITKYDIISGLK
jgi:cystathionine beta-synthase